MKQTQRSVRFISFVIFILAFCTTTFSSLADELDLARTVRVHIDYHSADEPISAALFNIYQIADIDETGRFSIKDPFISAGITPNMIAHQESWREYASLFDTHVSSNKIEPDAAVTTDENGFAFTELSCGLYLLSGTEVEHEWQQYKAENTLLMLPSLADDQTWIYDITIFPKPEITPIPKHKLQVVKIWNDSQNSSARPAMIDVELLRNEELYSTVSLSKSNGWSYQWNDLDARDRWTVREKHVPANYSVSYVQTDGRVIITNTRIGTPSSPDTSLPQTGLAWWPVSALALTGMLLFFFGWLLRRREP